MGDKILGLEESYQKSTFLENLKTKIVFLGKIKYNI